jgi:hypothetical protein
LRANHELSPSADVRDTDATSATSISPFVFRPLIDVERALTELALKDLQVEYVRCQEPVIEPLLHIQLTQDAYFRHVVATTSNVDDENGDNFQSPRHADLIPGIYEGGAKVWECSIDLLQYMVTRKHELLQKEHVLELGCGHALPSCWWLRERMSLKSESSVKNEDEFAFKVCFSDFNDFVVDNIVLSNISVNTRRHNPVEVAKHVLLGAGDWMDMSQQLLQEQMQHNNESPSGQMPFTGRFDLILAAETTYTEKAAQDTAEIMRRHLKINSGIGLVASKRYYFGVGGGTHAFCKYSMGATAMKPPSIGTPDIELVVTTLQVYDSGAGNIRELLKVQCISHSVSD